MKVTLKTLAVTAVMGAGALGLTAGNAAAALSGAQLDGCQAAGAKADLQALQTLVEKDNEQAAALVKCVVMANRGLAVQAALIAATIVPGGAIPIAVAAAEANPAAASAIFGAIAGLKTFRGNLAELAQALSNVQGVAPDSVAQINTQRDILVAPAAGGTPPGGAGGALALAPGASSGDNPNITSTSGSVSASGP